MADLISRSGVGGPPAPGALRPRRPSGSVPPRRPSGSVPPRRPSGSVPLGECAHGCRISLGPWHRPVKDIHTEGTPTRLHDHGDLAYGGQNKSESSRIGLASMITDTFPRIEPKSVRDN